MGSPSKNGFRVRRRHLAVLLTLLTLAAPAATSAGRSQETPLQQQLARALRVPHVAPARSAAIALDLATGTVLYSQNSSRSLAPASNEKLPLTYAALAQLGPAFRIETDVLGQGDLDGTSWLGALVLRGTGDPTLSSGDLRVLARKVRSAGIRRVTGGIIGDESWFDARRTVSGWKPSFFIDESPPLSALVVDRARVGRYVTRTPALAAATEFRAALRAAGVAVDGPVRVGRADEYSVPLGEVFSPPLATIIRFMDRESDNFTAELSPKQVCRRPACASWTAPASLGWTGSRRTRSAACSRLHGPIRSSGRCCSPPSRSQASTGRSRAVSASRPRAAVSSPRREPHATPPHSRGTCATASRSRCCRTVTHSRTGGRASHRIASRRS